MSQTKTQLIDSAYESTVLTGSTNNTITTVTGAKNIQGEANLTFDGTSLKVGASTSTRPISIYSASDAQIQFQGSGTGTGNNNADGFIVGNSGGVDATLWNYEDGYIRFATNNTERGRFESGGAFQVQDNIKIMTAGKGIDFSANSHAGGMTSELLDHYEEGSWTPTFFIGGNQATYSTGGQQGRYTKIGRLIYCQFMIDLATKGSGGSSSAVSISGLPYTSTNDSGDRMNGLVTYIGAFTGLDTGGIVLYNTTNTTSVTLYDAESTYTRTVKGENVENSSHLRGYVWYHC